MRYLVFGPHAQGRQSITCPSESCPERAQECAVDYCSRCQHCSSGYCGHFWALQWGQEDWGLGRWQSGHVRSFHTFHMHPSLLPPRDGEKTSFTQPGVSCAFKIHPPSDRSQSLFYFVPQESDSQAGSTTYPPSKVWNVMNVITIKYLWVQNPPKKLSEYCDLLQHTCKGLSSSFDIPGVGAHHLAAQLSSPQIPLCTKVFIPFQPT